MVEADKSVQHIAETPRGNDSAAVPFDIQYPRNIWVEKRQAVYERIDTLYVSAEVKKAMMDAVTSVIEICAWCMRERVPFRTVLRLADKKCLQIIEAESEEEVNSTLNLVRMSRDTG